MPDNVVILFKGDERFAFIFRDDQRLEAIAALEVAANDSDLDFSMYDAAVLAQKVRKVTEGV